MNIPDGEYDIDLSVLDTPSATEPSTLALRYGFIPDSMDQTSPLTLFQTNDVCILEAHKVERAHHTESLPIIFEGVTQKQRQSQGGGTLLPDSYFFSFSRAEKGSRSPLHVHLERLETTVRVNKSRNADKWRASLIKWRNEPNGKVGASEQTNKTSKAENGISSTLHPVKQRSPHVSSPLLPRKSGISQSTRPRNGKSKVTNLTEKKSTPLKKKTTASKRPPAPNQDENHDIISVSDFEDLESEGDDAFPIFEAPSEKAKTEPISHLSESDDNQKQENDSRSQIFDSESRSTLEKKPHDSSAKHAPESEESISDLEMEDEFADLEDQLDEVLVEGRAKAVSANSDSEDDSDTGAFVGTPLVIDMGEETTSSKTQKSNHVNNGKHGNLQSKPMSLHELYGAGKTDYLSSNEEE